MAAYSFPPWSGCFPNRFRNNPCGCYSRGCSMVPLNWHCCSQLGGRIWTRGSDQLRGTWASWWQCPREKYINGLMLISKKDCTLSHRFWDAKLGADWAIAQIFLGLVPDTRAQIFELNRHRERKVCCLWPLLTTRIVDSELVLSLAAMEADTKINLLSDQAP